MHCALCARTFNPVMEFLGSRPIRHTTRTCVCSFAPASTHRQIDDFGFYSKTCLFCQWWNSKATAEFFTQSLGANHLLKSHRWSNFEEALVWDLSVVFMPRSLLIILTVFTNTLCHCNPLGKPSWEKSAVFLNIVQKAFDPPPPFVWTSCGEFFLKEF